MNRPITNPKKPTTNAVIENPIAKLFPTEAPQNPIGNEANNNNAETTLTSLDVFTVNAIAHWRPDVNG